MNPTRRLITLYKKVRSVTYEDPTRDWLSLITLSLIVFAAILVWNIWAFDTVSNGGTLGGVVVGPQKVFDPSALSKMQKLFESRATEEAKYTNGTYRFLDPSQ